MTLKIHNLFILVALSIILSACNSANKKIILNSDPRTQPRQAVVNTDFLTKVNVDLTGLGYDGNQLSRSMSSTTSQAYYGYGSPESALVGALLGGSLIKEIEINAAIEEKNKPIVNYLSKLSKTDWNNVLNKSNLNIPWSISKGEAIHKDKLVVTPRLHVSADYRSLILSSFIERRDINNQLVYQNYFHIYSAPLLPWSETISNLNAMTAQEINIHLSIMLSQLDILIMKELTDWKKLPVKPGGQPIKFVNDMKEYYERGTILNMQDKFMTYRTLRGEIKHMPCKKCISHPLHTD